MFYSCLTNSFLSWLSPRKKDNLPNCPPRLMRTIHPLSPKNLKQATKIFLKSQKERQRLLNPKPILLLFPRLLSSLSSSLQRKKKNNPYWIRFHYLSEKMICMHSERARFCNNKTYAKILLGSPRLTSRTTNSFSMRIMSSRKIILDPSTTRDSTC